jgi:hypothetical protein
VLANTAGGVGSRGLLLIDIGLSSRSNNIGQSKMDKKGGDRRTKESGGSGADAMKWRVSCSGRTRDRLFAVADTLEPGSSVPRRARKSQQSRATSAC